MLLLNPRVDSSLRRIDSEMDREHIKDFHIKRASRFMYSANRFITLQRRSLSIKTPGNRFLTFRDRSWSRKFGRYHRSDIYVSRSESGGLWVNVPAYDNSGLSGIVHDRGPSD
ncbi:hypothetical protein PIB30_090038 [Stylosanthes scabra]|uniref:Uncharacterized protein n=1 Tax=Stylosanthes scabra TaxID=79078 RepID=A0ABU6WSI6_9FABA|nr:hypothetical protein [Stylosanthes scabra]